MKEDKDSKREEGSIDTPVRESRRVDLNPKDKREDYKGGKSNKPYDTPQSNQYFARNKYDSDRHGNKYKPQSDRTDRRDDKYSGEQRPTDKKYQDRPYKDNKRTKDDKGRF